MSVILRELNNGPKDLRHFEAIIGKSALTILRNLTVNGKIFYCGELIWRKI